jgi:hypothetical protein
MVFIGAFPMENNIKKINWEKISTGFAGLALIITLWSCLNQTQRDISDLKERIAKLEVKVEHLEEKK